MITHIPDDIPVILDAKRGDIGALSLITRKHFGTMDGVDAVTISLTWDLILWNRCLNTLVRLSFIGCDI